MIELGKYMYNFAFCHLPSIAFLPLPFKNQHIERFSNTAKVLGFENRRKNSKLINDDAHLVYSTDTPWRITQQWTL
jgi:hypothetical protein